MVVAQKLKEAEITEQDSLLLTRNLLRIAIFNISYIRGLFPEKYFNDKSVPALEMKIKKLMPMDAESRRLIDWMEKGVYDALQKKYLRSLLFCICETVEGPMIEEYAFSFNYSNSDNQEVSMNINRTGTKKSGAFKCDSTTEVTPNQMRSSACKMVRTLVQLMRTLDRMPEERTILMKLFYYEDVTPEDYEPPFFKSCSEEEAHHSWIKSPLKMEVGNVNSKHFALALKVKSVLDPCEDENDDNQDDDVSLGDDSMQRDDDYSESDTEVNQSRDNADQYILAPVDKQMVHEQDGIADADDTQDPAEDEQQLVRVKDWISSRHTDTIELTDVLSNFPDISMVLTEEIMDKIVKDGFLTKTGRDSYTITKTKGSQYEFSPVKEEMEIQVVGNGDKTPIRKSDDYIYMKALYHALPMKYVTAVNLQSKLEGEANLTSVRKLITKMTSDGFLEAKSNRKLGKRVIRSSLTEKKLIEVKKVIDNEAMDLDNHEPPNKSSHMDIQTENYPINMSTCGGLHSIGSDLTRIKGRSDSHMSDTNTPLALTQKHVNTPTSNAKPIASMESCIPGKDKSRLHGCTDCDEAENAVGNRSQETRFRKASLVKEPILQYVKRQKSAL